MTKPRTFSRTRIVAGETHECLVSIFPSGTVRSETIAAGHRMRPKVERKSRYDVPAIVSGFVMLGYREVTVEPDAPYRLEQIPGARKGEDWRVMRDGRGVIYGSRADCAAALLALNIWAASEGAAA